MKWQREQTHTRTNSRLSDKATVLFSQPCSRAGQAGAACQRQEKAPLNQAVKACSGEIPLCNRALYLRACTVRAWLHGVRRAFLSSLPHSGRHHNTKQILIPLFARNRRTPSAHGWGVRGESQLWRRHWQAPCLHRGPLALCASLA